MKKSPGCWILFFYFFILFLSIAEEFAYLFEDMNLNPFDYARITDVDYTAELVDEPNSNGKIIVTERLTFDIHAASKDNPFWELWRDLPEAYIDGVKVDYKVNSVKQILSNNEEVIYDKSTKLYWDDYDYISSTYGPGKWYHSKGPYNESQRRYECVFFYVDGLYREEVVFEIEYEMSNAALRYNDCSELYLCMYSEDTIKYLESFNGQILIPNKDMPNEGNYYAHTYGTNSNDFDFTESATKNPGYYTFSFELDKSDLKFRPYNEYIEFSLVSFGDDKHKFTEYASKNDYYYDDVLAELEEEQDKYEATPINFTFIKIIVFILILPISNYVFKYSSKLFEKLKEKYNFYEPEVDYEYFRDIPSDLDPTFASALVFCKDKGSNEFEEEYSAIILSLVRKGYIELVRSDSMKDWTNNNVKIIVKYKPNLQDLLSAATISYNTLLEEKHKLLLDALKDDSELPTSDNQETAEITPLQQLTQDYLNDYNTESQELPLQETNEDMLNQNILEEQNAKLEELADKINSYKLELNKFEPLTLTEQYYFNLIVRHSNGIEISMSQLQSKVSYDYDYTDTFVRNIKNSITNIGISQSYFQKKDYEQPKQQAHKTAKKFMIWGILITVLVNIISYNTRLDLAFGAFFILGIAFIISSKRIKNIAKKCVLLTQFGEDEYAKWRGLYNFLNSETLMNERTVIELPLWEKYLVYATAFGVSDKVIKALRIRCPEANLSPVLRNPYYRSTHFRTSSRSFRTTTHRTSSYARSSYYSGYGGHGGYGGGGRGGGGGRRRSLNNL